MPNLHVMGVRMIFNIAAMHRCTQITDRVEVLRHVICYGAHKISESSRNVLRNESTQLKP